ncbi:MAG: hypothetical protein OXE86_15905 [Alphaproteobacteria bacterium]|nr:hypothetical protein [Alphaproteobacteria bacterium]
MRVTACVGWLCLGILLAVPAGPAVPDIPLTPRELQSALAGASNPSVWTRLYPSSTALTGAAPLVQRNYRTRWLSASHGDRVHIAQQIGEQGVARYADGRQLKTLLSPFGHRAHIGPDSIFWNRASGKVQVLEAKGGSSVPKWTYRSIQGTNVNAIRSADGVLARSSASLREKLQAARVIKAAQRGHLETGVVRTAHVLGTPRAPTLSARMDVGNVTREARQLERQLVRQNPKLRRVFATAGSQHRVGRLAYRTSQVGRVASRWVLPIRVGLAGASLTVAIAKFANASISSREFLRASADPALLVVFTGAGALIGGLTSSGIGTIPGAAAGAMIALPVQLGLEWVIDRYYRDFHPAQQNAVDQAIKVMYFGTGSRPRQALSVPAQ